MKILSGVPGPRRPLLSGASPNQFPAVHPASAKRLPSDAIKK